MDIRSYGVEIECLMPVGMRHSDITKKMGEVGLDCPARGYDHTILRTWKVVTDSSLSGGSGSGAELVSPPLTGPDGLKQISMVCRILASVEVSINKTCALHVHIDGRQPKLELPALKRLALFYVHHEPLIDELMPPSRRGDIGSFCRTLKGKRKIADVSDIAELAKALRDGKDSRFCKLNFNSLFKYGTIEFRQHPGTIDADKIWHWIQACMRMVNFASRPESSLAHVLSSARSMHPRRRSKSALVYEMLLRPQGCSLSEVLAATGWRQASVAGVGHNYGLNVVKQRINGETRYVGQLQGTDATTTATSMTVSSPIFRTLDSMLEKLGMTEEEQIYWRKRAELFRLPQPTIGQRTISGGC